VGPIPEEDGQLIFLSANAEGSPGAVDLAASGYVDNEYFRSGGANTYRYDELRRVDVDRADVP